MSARDYTVCLSAAVASMMAARAALLSPEHALPLRDAIRPQS